MTDCKGHDLRNAIDPAKMSTEFDGGGIAWNDPQIGIVWLKLEGQYK